MKLMFGDDGVVGTVRSTRAFTVQPGAKLLAPGLSKAGSGISTPVINVLTEAVPEEALPGVLIVTPSIMKIDGKSVSCFKQHVEVHNVSSRPITVPSRSMLCALHRVQVIPPGETGANADLTEEEYLQLFNWPSNPDHANAMKSLLLKWKSIFSQGSLDYGRTDHVKHAIRLTDDIPKKLRHRRVPPAMVDEVRDHLREMLTNS